MTIDESTATDTAAASATAASAATEGTTAPGTDQPTEAATTEPAAIDMDKLMAFVFRAVDEVGAALNAALVVMGDQLGYYRALAERGPLTAADLARTTSTGEKYAREWLNAQAAGQYVDYEPSTASYSICPEYAIALTDESSPAFLPGLFQIAHGTVRDASRIIEPARSGDGLGWHDHNTDVHVGCERFFRPGYLANLVDVWLPALDGVVPKLQRGARVADIACGHGASTVIMAQAYPASTFIGTDYHEHPSRRLASGPRRPDWANRSASTSPPATGFDGGRTTWSPPSTRCTTWATRSVRPSRSMTCWPTTAPG